MSSVGHSYVLMCHPYVTHMYLCVICMSLVCTRMSSLCHLYVVSPWTFSKYQWYNLLQLMLFIPCDKWKIFFNTNLLLTRGLLKPPHFFVLWNKCFEKSAHFISIIFTITLQCCLYRRSTTELPLPKFVDSVFYLLFQFVNISHIFKTQKLSRGIFLVRATLKFLWHQFSMSKNCFK